MSSNSDKQSSEVGCLLFVGGLGIAASVFFCQFYSEPKWIFGIVISALILFLVNAIHNDAKRLQDRPENGLQDELSKAKAKCNALETQIDNLQQALTKYKHEEKEEIRRENYYNELDADLRRKEDGIKLASIEEKKYLSTAQDQLNKREADLKANLENLEKAKKILQIAWEEKSNGYPTLAELAADAWMSVWQSEVKYRAGRAPATAAELKQKLSSEIRQIKRNELIYRNLVEYYESTFPGIEELRDDHLLEETQEDVGDEDRRRNWLTPEEWSTKTDAEKSQLALERYLARTNKSNWEIGIEYERWCGYRLETQGWQVVYHGAVRKFDDLGRDIIARKVDTNEVLVVQCKRWSREKIIHEKHVFQTYGTMVAMRIDEPDQKIRGLLVTSTILSERARKFAELLDVEVLENKQPSDFPRIKCNKKSLMGDVYHLPFDQQYDSIVIHPEKGDFYCQTVQEAEEKGFRRAKRWFGS